MYYTCQMHLDAFILPVWQHRRGVKHVRLDSQQTYILQMGHYLLKEPASKPHASATSMRKSYKAMKQMCLHSYQ